MERCCAMSRHKYQKPARDARDVQIKVLRTLAAVAIREGQALEGGDDSAYTRFGNARIILEDTLFALTSGRPWRVAKYLPPRLREGVR